MNPDCKALGTAMPVDTYPGLGFEQNPSWIPQGVVIPTLDDVPDGNNSPPDPAYGAGGWTAADLKFLDQNNLHWDFFINTDNWCGPIVGDPSKDDAQCDQSIQDILKLHNPANHTVHHIHMGDNLPPDTSQNPPVPQGCDGSQTTVTCAAEMDGVEAVINKMSNGARPHLTRFRPPFGEPYQSGGPGNLTDVEKVVAKYAVWVGWQIDSGDSSYNGTDCRVTPCPTAQDIVNNVTSQLEAGHWGIILTHGTYPWTAGAIPTLYDPHTGYMATHNHKVATVEDAICWKYGKHSWDIVKQLTGQARTPN